MASPRTNLLLESLSLASREHLLSLSRHVELPVRAWIQTPDESPQFAYFVTAGIASFVVELAEGGSAEVALMVREGLTCSLSLLGPAAASIQGFMQMAGSGYRIPFGEIKKIFRESEEIRTRILEHAQQQSLTSTHIVACNRLHEAEPRLARWLLMVQDRVEDDAFHLTQEFLAQMLGTQRRPYRIQTRQDDHPRPAGAGADRLRLLSVGQTLLHRPLSGAGAAGLPLCLISGRPTPLKPVRRALSPFYRHAPALPSPDVRIPRTGC
jgi:CRP-like cAMP-binding protein